MSTPGEAEPEEGTELATELPVDVDVDVDVDEACVGSSLPPPPPPHALTSALTATARVEPRTVSNKFKAIWVTEVGMSRSQSSSTANPEDTCCDALSIGEAREVSECKKQEDATSIPTIGLERRCPLVSS